MRIEYIKGLCFQMQLLTIIICCSVISSVSWAINVPLILQERSGVTRVSEPVTFGFPITENANITDVDTLCVVNGSGVAIPAQFRVLERWNTAVNNTTGKIKWVLVDFQASVSANSIANYYLQNSSQTISPSYPLVSSNNNGVVTISTGNYEFVINKNNFGIITSATVGSTQVFSNVTNGGIEETGGGATYLGKNSVPEVFEIEESGPMRTVIHAEGYNTSSTGTQGLRYVCRVHFYAGKQYAKVVYYYIHDKNLHGATLNDTVTVGQVDRTINNLEVNFRMSYPSSLSYAMGNLSKSSPWSGSIPSGSDIYGYQSAFNVYSLSGSGSSSTGKLTGWVNLYDNTKGIMIAAKNFANKWPHALYMDSTGAVTYKILPDNAGTHNFYIYQAFREEFLVYIHGATRYVGEMQNLAEGFMQDPIFPHPSKEYLCSSRGLGELSPYPSANYPSFDAGLDDAYNRSVSLQNSMNLNGRWDYGCLWDSGLSMMPSNYYDGIGVATRQFGRSADLKWFDFARKYAENFTSLDQYYCGVGTKDRARWNGISSGYGGVNHRSGNYLFASWMEGTLLLYRLTGDEWFFDRGVDLANTYISRGTDKNSSYAWGLLAREGAQAFLTVLRIWEITRSSTLYSWWTSHANKILSYQQSSGVFVDPVGDSRHWQAIMNCGPGLYQAYIDTGNTIYRDAIVNYANAMQPAALGGCMVYNAGNGYDYVESGCTQTWAADNCANTGPRINCVNAYAFLLTGNQKYFNEAHRQLKYNFETYGADNGLGKTANTYHWVMEMEGILSNSLNGGSKTMAEPTGVSVQVRP